MQRGLVLIVIIVGIGLHWPFGRADFSYDDDDFILTNESVRSMPSAVRAFGQPFPPAQVVRGLYRPVTNFSFALDYLHSGHGARGYHRSNAILYGLVVLLVYGLARRYHPSPWFAFCVALFFASHPVHCDAVDSISGRSEILALLFSLASILAFLRVWAPRPGPEWSWLAFLALSVGFYALACLSKETGVVVPGILVAHLLLFRGTGVPSWREGKGKRAALLLAPFVVVLAGYLLVRIIVLGAFSPAIGVFQGASLFRQLHAMGLVYFEYLQLFFVPRILQVDFYYRYHFANPRETLVESALGWIAMGGLVALTLWLARRVLRADGRAELDETAGFPVLTNDADRALGALVIFFCFFLPYSHVFKIGAIMAERFLFAPSLGLVMAAVVLGDLGLRRGLPSAGSRRALAAVIVSALVGLGGARSIARAAEWRDDLRLWQAAARDLPPDHRVYSNLATAYMDRGEPEKAREPLARALELDPNEPMLRRNQLRLEQMLETRGRNSPSQEP